MYRPLGRRLLWSLMPLLTLSAIAASRAATFHVATSGNDAAAGTSTQPWRTLQKAASTARAGDVVLVANGTYAGFETQADGTASARIVFRANGGSVVINAPSANSSPDHINIEGADYVTVEGFIVQDAARIGIRAVTATGVIIQGNVVTRSGLTGILSGYTTRIEVIDNVVSDTEGEHGIYVSNSTSASDNPVVRGNECFGNAHNGIQFNGDCYAGGDGIISGAVIEDNIVHHNGWKGFSLISVQGSTIRNNLLYENGLAAGAGAIHLADEPGCGKPSSNNLVVNNTIHEPRIAGIRMTNGSTANTIFNNLVVASSLSKTIVDESGGNFIDGASNLKRTSTTGLFAAPAAGDYHLAPSSTALNTAVTAYRSTTAPIDDIDGTARPQGPSPDAGAYEHVVATGAGDAPVLDVTLEQNVPNPFNPSTRIGFTVGSPAAVRVSLDVFDVQGRHVRELMRDRPATGPVQVVWDGRDDRGQPVSSGVYFYRLVAGSTTVTRRMTLLK